MFARVTQSAAICRCQSRLAPANAPWPKAESVFKPTIPVRRHSAAVARVEEEEEEQEVDNGYNPQEEVVERKHHKRLTRHKRLKIASVAELGIPSLGQPAEVLVLQPRDRSIPKVPTHTENETNQNLLESLETENKPLSPGEVRENIEQIKAPFGTSGGELNEIQWQLLRKRLVSGFTYKQLVRYIEDVEKEAAEKGPEPSTTRNPSRSFMRLNPVLTAKGQRSKHQKKLKSRASFHIMLDVWGFSIKGAGESSNDVSSLEIILPSHELEVLLIHREQPLKKLANTLRLQIDLFREKRKVVITGSAKAAVEARKALQVLRKGIMETRMRLGDSKMSPPFEADARHEKTLYQSVARNHNVFLDYVARRGNDLLRLHYHTDNKEDALGARRELLLAIQRPKDKPKTFVWPARYINQKPVEWIAFPPILAFDLLDRQRSWGRWSMKRPRITESESSSSAEEQDSVPLEARIEAIHSHLQKSYLSQDFLCSQKKNVIEENLSSFGQTLFLQEGTASKTNFYSIVKHGTSSPYLLPQSRMVADVPLLIPFLATQNRWADARLDARKNTPKRPESQTSPSSAPLHYRLTLIPSPEIQTLIGQPTIEITLAGEDINAGLRQPLQVRSVTALLEERSQTLLLPEGVVDIAFVKQRKYVFYAATHDSPRPETGPLLSELLRYFNISQGKESPSFEPFMRLTIPNTLAERFDVRNKIDPPTPKGPEDPKAAKAETSRLVVKNREGLVTQYMLAKAEAVDGASFTHASYRGLFLNYTQLRGDAWHGDRQMLQLAEHPHPELHLAGKKPFDFTKFFSAAYGVATRLGDVRLIKTPD